MNTPTPEREQSRLLDVAEVATITGTSERMVRRLFAERALPTVKVGRYVRVWSHDLYSYLAARTRPANQGPQR